MHNIAQNIPKNYKHICEDFQNGISERGKGVEMMTAEFHLNSVGTCNDENFSNMICM